MTTKKKTRKVTLATSREKQPITFTMPKVKVLKGTGVKQITYPNYNQAQLEGFQDKLRKQIAPLQDQLTVVEFLLNTPEAKGKTWVE